MSNPLIVSKKNESEHGFRVEKFFNSERNDFDIHVLFNNQIIRKIYLDGEIVKSYSGYCLIHKDLSNACEWMQKAIDLDENNEYTNSIGKTDEFEYFDYNDPVVKALFVASLTFYGKAFTEAQGRRTQLNLDLISPDFREFHLEVMRYRHHYAAHSGESKIETSNTYLLLITNEKNHFNPTLYTSRMQPSLFSPKQLLNLFKHVLEIVEEKMDKGKNRIFQLVCEKNRIYWELKANVGDVVNVDNIQKEINLKNQKRNLLKSKRK